MRSVFKIKIFWNDDAGSTALEYGLLIALIAAVGVFAAARFGVVNAETFTILGEALGG